MLFRSHISTNFINQTGQYFFSNFFLLKCNFSLNKPKLVLEFSTMYFSVHVTQRNSIFSKRHANLKQVTWVDGFCVDYAEGLQSTFTQLRVCGVCCFRYGLEWHIGLRSL